MSGWVAHAADGFDCHGGVAGRCHAHAADVAAGLSCPMGRHARTWDLGRLIVARRPGTDITRGGRA